MYKTQKLNKCLSLTISKDKSFLEILDSFKETKEEEIKTNYTNKCKCCTKFILTNTENHQTICFQKKIKKLEEQINNLEIRMKLREDQIKHDIHIKGIELLIERNDKKWNKLYKNI
jgi:hypothetical protein